MSQISFLSIDPSWVFSSRTGKTCQFKRLHFYIYFMPSVLLKIKIPAKRKSHAFAPEQKKCWRQACWAVPQAAVALSERDTCWLASPRAPPHLAEERAKCIPKAELATKTKTMKKTSRAIRGSWHGGLPWEAQKAFIFAPSRSLSWTLDPFPAIRNYFFHFYCENTLKYKLWVSEKTHRTDKGKNI